MTFGSMPGISVGTTPLAVNEALTLLASAAEMPTGEQVVLASRFATGAGAAKLTEAVSRSERMVERCIVAINMK